MDLQNPAIDVDGNMPINNKIDNALRKLSKLKCTRSRLFANSCTQVEECQIRISVLVKLCKKKVNGTKVNSENKKLSKIKEFGR